MASIGAGCSLPPIRCDSLIHGFIVSLFHCSIVEPVPKFRSRLNNEAMKQWNHGTMESSSHLFIFGKNFSFKTEKHPSLQKRYFQKNKIPDLI